MLSLSDAALPTRRFRDYGSLSVLGVDEVLFARSDEDRSAAVLEWAAASTEAIFVRVSANGAYDMRLEYSGNVESVGLRDRAAQTAFWSKRSGKRVAIDITGLTHSVWATLIRGAMRAGCEVFVTYAEPKSYTRSDAPTEGQIFDLSERIDGVMPIPGFAAIGEDADSRVLVPMLGFEGTRFQYLLTVVQPAASRVVPIVGIPGFRIEYPFYTYLGNRAALLETDSWSEVRFAAANCPFSALYSLQDLRERLGPMATMAIAPIGTKPHALAAVLFYLTSSGPVELVYDHPVRSRGRTEGATTVSVYDLRDLVLAEN